MYVDIPGKNTKVISVMYIVMLFVTCFAFENCTYGTGNQASIVTVVIVLIAAFELDNCWTKVTTQLLY